MKTGKTVAIVQSSYIPWKGYFDLIASADQFILLDDVQYTARDWRNRNRIKTREGTAWLSIPVHTKGRYLQAIKEVQVSDATWRERHWKTILHNYRQAKYFDAYADRFQALYLDEDDERLSAINYRFLKAICDALAIETKIGCSMEFPLLEGKTERLVDLCRQCGATRYLSGPSARAYIDASQFEAADIELSYFTYGPYPEYDQLFPPFVHEVTALDVLFNLGPRAPEYVLGGR